MPISEKQLVANRANAKLSTGPCTEEGKARASMNGFTSILTGLTAVMTNEDRKFADAFIADCDVLGAAGVRAPRVPGGVLPCGAFLCQGGRRGRAAGPDDPGAAERVGLRWLRLQPCLGAGCPHRDPRSLAGIRPWDDHEHIVGTILLVLATDGWDQSTLSLSPSSASIWSPAPAKWAKTSSNALSAKGARAPPRLAGTISAAVTASRPGGCIEAGLPLLRNMPPASSTAPLESFRPRRQLPISEIM